MLSVNLLLKQIQIMSMGLAGAHMIYKQRLRLKLHWIFDVSKDKSESFSGSRLMSNVVTDASLEANLGHVHGPKIEIRWLSWNFNHSVKFWDPKFFYFKWSLNDDSYLFFAPKLHHQTQGKGIDGHNSQNIFLCF